MNQSFERIFTSTNQPLPNPYPRLGLQPNLFVAFQSILAPHKCPRGHLNSKSGPFCNMGPLSTVCTFPPCMQTLLAAWSNPGPGEGWGDLLASELGNHPKSAPSPTGNLPSCTHGSPLLRLHTCAWI